MWINDGVTSPFGFAIGLGAPVVSAWLNAVASDDSYGANDATYFDTNRQINEPMGRASAIAVAATATTRRGTSARSARPRA